MSSGSSSSRSRKRSSSSSSASSSPTRRPQDPMGGAGAMMPRPDSSSASNKNVSSGRTHGGKNNRKSNPNRPFESSFALPPPRRAAPSLHHADPLTQPLLNGHNNGGAGGAGGSSSSSGGTTTRGGVRYRSADSTQRALNELARRKHERMERRRAAMLLCALLGVAICVHLGMGGLFGSRSDDDGGGQQGMRGSSRGGGGDAGGRTDSLMAGGGLVGGGNGTQLLAGGQQQLQAGGMGVGGPVGINGAPLDVPVEPIIPEDKPHLGPIRYFADVRDPVRPTDTAFFFHVPRSGGQTYKDIVGQCLGKVQASEVGVRDGHGMDPTLSVVNIANNRYVNVDTTSVEGLQRAAQLGLSQSQMADMVTSSYLKEAGTIFDLNHQGRAFTVLRNPIHRAVSMYYFRTRGDAADLDPDLPLESFAQGEGIENNWMTRFLIDRMEGELTKKDLEMAKEVLETKFLIGLLEDGAETMDRIMKYYGWTYAEDETERMRQEDCVDMLLRDGTNVGPEPEYELPKKGTQSYALISWQTQFDMKLYEYAKELFEKQTKLWGTKERKKEMKKKKKKDDKKR